MYQYCSPKEIKPKGWLEKQLRLQAKGLAGNLDKIWPDVKDSAWIGGDKEGWERVPYWLDGFIPLAFLLEDEDMMARAKKYVDAIVSFQQEDGWICPCAIEKREKYDIWSWFLIAKVLALYCEFTEDETVYKALYKTLKCMYEMAQDGKLKLFSWGKFRWFECLIPLDYLYEKQPEDWIFELAKYLRCQGTDYEEYCELWKRPLNHWKFETHIVNIAMMLKTEAVCAHLLGEDGSGQAERFWQILEKYNGTAAGVFTGDECLSGIGNNRGTELCSVVELMYSCEILYAVTKDPVWMQRLEKMAFNALPAAISDDMWTHQYDQMVNQISCVRFPGKSFFRTNFSDAHLFGLEPNFGCCTANHGQGWPKLVMSLFRKEEKAIEATMMLPGRLETTMDGIGVAVEADTRYPFRHSALYSVSVQEPVEFALKIRIPDWAKQVRINGESVPQEDYYVVKKRWKGTEQILIELQDVPHFAERPFDLKTVEYGPLVFALPLQAKYRMQEYEKDGVERKYPYCDYELERCSEWRYGFAAGESEDAAAAASADGAGCPVFEMEFSEGDAVPFSSANPPLRIKTDFVRVDWDYADGYEDVAEKAPVSAKALSERRSLEMVPYGCAKLRMTEMPLAKRQGER